MREIRDCYYKVYAGPQMISGLRLCYPDQIVKNINFIDCDFHPSCRDAKFVNCNFTDCTGSFPKIRDTD